MLVRFSVENFKSIREEQTLSMVASNYEKELPENVIELNVPGMKGVNLLKSAVIYGANASGKSNLLKALTFFEGFIEGSATQSLPGDEIGVEPFLLDSTCRSKPTRFSMTFIHNNKRYDYGMVLDYNQIFEEYLYEYPHKRIATVFERKYENGEYTYKYGSKFSKKSKLEIRVRKDIEKKTKKNTLLLSSAAQWNDRELTPIYFWFKEKMRNLTEAPIWFTETQIIEHGDELQLKVENLLKEADFGIDRIKIKTLKEIPVSTPNNLDERDFKIMKNILFRETIDTEFLHKVTDTGDFILFKKSQESSGTLRYYHLLGPWLKVLNAGLFSHLDEIDTSLHPLLVRKLIQIFHDKNMNKNNAQLLFTTHDTTLLSADLFRRDQIWLTEKSHEGNTVLYPLSDYKVRKGESLQKGYLAGRYGAIPFFGSEIEING